jgi:hypothetical protein
MPRVTRLLWRLDYVTSYAYLDKRGSALRAIFDTEQGFWNSVGIGTAVPASFVAQNADSVGQRFLSLEPTSLNGSVEWFAGIDIGNVLRDEAFRGTNKVVQEVLRVCEIRVMTRAGIRLVCVGKFADGRRDSLRRISELYETEFYHQAQTTLGEIKDVSMTLEGVTGDNVGYRATFGPYARKNVEAAFTKKLEPQEYERLDENDLFFDIDLFENGISFIEHSLFRWSNTKVAKIAEFIALFEAPRFSALRA